MIIDALIKCTLDHLCGFAGNQSYHRRFNNILCRYSSCVLQVINQAVYVNAIKMKFAPLPMKRGRLLICYRENVKGVTYLQACWRKNQDNFIDILQGFCKIARVKKSKCSLQSIFSLQQLRKFLFCSGSSRF